MALLQSSFNRLTLSNAHTALKCAYINRLSTSAPVWKLSIEEKLGIQPKPKRPKSSFLRFLSQIKPQILQDNPKATVTQINKIAGERWRVIDDKTKESLSEEYKTEWGKYLEAVKRYDKMLSPLQKEELQKAQETMSQLKKKKKIKQKMVELGKPKKPASTFVTFMQSKISERGAMPFKEWQAKITKEWETASSSLKDKFNAKYQSDVATYKLELEKWEKKMKKEGHKELVRRTR